MGTALRNLTVLFLTLGGLAPGPAAAQLHVAQASNRMVPPAAEQTCNQVEIVFLVDQSGSMGGSKFGSWAHPTPNDPLELRFESVRYAIEAIGQRFVSQRGVPGAQPPVFSVAVVNFGSSTEVSLDWVSLDPKDEASWNSRLEELRHAVSAERFDLGNMGDTSFVAAFQEVVNQFRKRGPQQADGSGNACPRRAVLLLTDGEPFTQEASFSVEGHMSEVDALVRKEMPKPGYLLYVTGVNDPKTPQFWGNMLPYWKPLAVDDSVPLKVPGTALAVNKDQIGSRYGEIIRFLEGRPEGVTEPGEFSVEPYTQLLAVTLFKESIEEHLAVRDEENRPVEGKPDGSVRRIGVDKPIETLYVRRPNPGKWLLETTATRSNVKLEVIPISTSATFRAPTGAGAQQFVRTRLGFQLADSEGIPLPRYNNPRYRLDVSGTIRAAGREWPVAFREGSTPHGYEAEFVPVERGEHVLSILGKSQGVTDKVLTVVNGPVGALLVNPTEAEEVRDSGGARRDCSSHYEHQPFDLRYRLRGPDDKPVMADLPIRWNAQGGVAGQPAQPVKIDGPDSKGLFIGSYTPTVTGGHRLSVVAAIVEPLAGQERQIFKKDYTLDVSPGRPLKPLLEQPQSGNVVTEKLALRFGIPILGLERQPIDVKARLLEPTSGKPIDISSGAAGDLGRLLSAEVRRSDTGEALPDLPLRPSGVEGQIVGSLANLSAGRYSVSIPFPPKDPLPCGFVALTGGPARSTSEIEVMDDPMYYWIILAGLVVLAMLAAIAPLVARRFWDPWRGCMGVLDVNDRPVGDQYIWAETGNHWDRFAAFPPQWLLANMEVRNDLRPLPRVLWRRWMSLFSLLAGIWFGLAMLWVWAAKGEWETSLGVLAILGIAITLVVRRSLRHGNAPRVRVRIKPARGRDRAFVMDSGSVSYLTGEYRLAYRTDRRSFS